MSEMTPPRDVHLTYGAGNKPEAFPHRMEANPPRWCPACEGPMTAVMILDERSGTVEPCGCQVPVRIW